MNIRHNSTKSQTSRSKPHSNMCSRAWGVGIRCVAEARIIVGPPTSKESQANHGDGPANCNKNTNCHAEMRSEVQVFVFAQRQAELKKGPENSRSRLARALVWAQEWIKTESAECKTMTYWWAENSYQYNTAIWRGDAAENKNRDTNHRGQDPKSQIHVSEPAERRGRLRECLWFTCHRNGVRSNVIHRRFGNSLGLWGQWVQL